jgi:hypothetical protein
VQAVGRRKVSGRQRPRPNRLRVLRNLSDGVAHEPDARSLGGVVQRRMQRGPANTEACSRSEHRLDLVILVLVTNSAQGPPLRGHPEAVEVSDGVRHHALAARLVQRPTAMLDDDRL